MTNTSEQIVIRAFDNKRQQPVVCRPLQDRTGKLYTGQGASGYFETLLPAERQLLGFVITHDTAVILTDGKILNMNDIVDAANWKWLQKHPYLAISKDKKNRDTVFYIEDRKQEAEKRVTANRQRDLARYHIQFGLSLDKLRYVAKVLGNLAADSFQEMELKDWLLQFADTAPDAIISAAEPKNTQESDAKILYNELVKWHVIKKFKGGVYKFGGENGLYVGHTEDQIVKFLNEQSNTETVAALEAELRTRQSQA